MCQPLRVAVSVEVSVAVSVAVWVTVCCSVICSVLHCVLLCVTVSAAGRVPHPLQGGKDKIKVGDIDQSYDHSSVNCNDHSSVNVCCRCTVVSIAVCNSMYICINSPMNHLCKPLFLQIQLISMVHCKFAERECHKDESSEWCIHVNCCLLLQHTATYTTRNLQINCWSAERDPPEGDHASCVSSPQKGHSKCDLIRRMPIHFTQHHHMLSGSLCVAS